MKALKKICTALMLLAFAFVFASCSSGSDDDDDNGSVGENVLAGNSYQYSKSNEDKTKTVTYAFKDGTVTETKVEKETGEPEETEITEYSYTYNADKGLLYLKIISWTCDGIKMTSMNDVYKFFAEIEGCSVEEAKQEFGDEDMFAEKTTICYFIKDNGNILLGSYFDDDEDVKYSKFVYAEDTTLRVKFDSEKIELTGAIKADWEIELDAKAKTFSGSDIAGSYTVKAKATKTLKELNGNYDSRNKANGYITINFSKLPGTLSSATYNMTTGIDYEFIFDLDCDEYTKM